MYDNSTTPIFSCHIACPKCHEYFLRRQPPNYVCPGCGFVHAADSDKDMQEYANSYIAQEETIVKSSNSMVRETDIKCPICGAFIFCDESMVLTSNPPQHRYYCPECGEFSHTAFSDGYLQDYILKKFGKVSTCASSQPEDPVNIHDEISKGFTRIENVIREESAKMAEIIRQAVVENTYPYRTAAPQVVWTNYIPEACRSCTNHPSNGGSGNCNCTLGSPSVTCNSIDCPGR